MRAHYQTLVQQLDQCRAEKSAAAATLRARTKEARGAKAEVKKAAAQVATITRQQAQNEKLKSCASWSGCALGANTLLFETLRHYDAQHKIPEYLLNSDYVFAGTAWLLTSLFAAAAHAYYSYD